MTLKKGWGMLLKNYPLKVGNAPEKSHASYEVIINMISLFSF
jgi:hypothetical protein